MEDKFLPKADLTKTIENVYNDTFQNPMKSSSGIVTTVLDFFHNTVLYPMQKYNLYANSKLENYANNLLNKMQSIPTENLISPRINILGPTIDGLKYNLDEEYIKEMFTNILISDMDNRKQNKVLPSYIDIVKQLSKDDVEFLIFLSKIDSIKPAIELQVVTECSSGYIPIEKYIIYDYYKKGNFTSYSTKMLNSLVLDNLLRLKLLECDFENKYYPKATEQYKTLFDHLQSQHILKSNQSLEYSKGYVDFTDFGRNFIDICLS